LVPKVAASVIGFADLKQLSRQEEHRNDDFCKKSVVIEIGD
jgi:hypothetical protein